MDTLYIDETITDEYTNWTITARNAAGVGTEFINDYGKGVLAYNPYIELYIGKYTDPVRPLVYLPNEEIQYKAVIHDASKTIIWLIPRNASASIVASLNYGITTENEMWEKHTISLDDYTQKKEEYADYKHVVVVQNPLSRFSGWVEYLLSKQALDSHLLNSIPETKQDSITPVDTAVWQVAALARLVNANPTFDVAPQLLSQSHFISKLPAVDVIVPLPYLDYYLHNELGVLPVHKNMDDDPVFWMGQLKESDKLLWELAETYADDAKLLLDEKAWTYDNRH